MKDVKAKDLKPQNQDSKPAASQPLDKTPH